LKEVHLPQGTIRYRDTGHGQPIVFVHGFMVDGRLWRKVTPLLEHDHRCIAPDWPIGSHEVPMNRDADVSPPGVAKMIADFIEALGLENVTLVGNDSGGALTQIVAAEHPKRIGRIVLTNCDAYDNFPPKGFRWLTKAANIPGFVYEMAQPMRLKSFRNGPLAFGHLAKHGLDQEILEGWCRPGIRSRAIRRDIRKFLRELKPEHTLSAAAKLKRFDKPALIAWAAEEKLFPFSYAERLASDLPNARLVKIADSWAFIPEDQPQQLADAITAFMRETAAA
ncbi:MAG: alpha/beta fold hydrolase, partial [Actinomycetota bacterium]